MDEKVSGKPAAASRNTAIDLLRFVFAVIIMLHHSRYVVGYDNCVFAGGSLAVEFFFIVSGWLCARAAASERAKCGGVIEDLGRRTRNFLLRKIRGVFPEVLVSFVIGFFYVAWAEGMSRKEMLYALAADFWELMLTRMSGLYTGGFNGVVWYISAMLLCMAVLYPLLLKHADLMENVVCILIPLFLFGYLCRTAGFPRDPAVWLGFVYKGLVRAMADICLGIVSYKLTCYLTRKKVTSAGKALCLLAAAALYAVCIWYMYTEKPSEADYLFIFLLFIAVTLTFTAGSGKSGKGLSFLASYSTALYVAHLYFSQHLVWTIGDGRKERIISYAVTALINGFIVWCGAKFLRRAAGPAARAAAGLFWEKD